MLKVHKDVCISVMLDELVVSSSVAKGNIWIKNNGSMKFIHNYDRKQMKVSSMKFIHSYDRKQMKVSLLLSIIGCIPVHDTYFIELFVELLVCF